MVERVKGLKRGPSFFLAGVVALIALALATRGQWAWVLNDDEAQTRDVEAPTLTDIDTSTERLYRIAPNDGSTLTYSVEENLAAADRTASGSTSVMAGDIAINTDDPDATRLGQMVINVEMLESDSTLRDKRIRHDFLESTHWPFATFEATEISGLPATIATGDGATTEADITITGDLTLKEATNPVTFSGSARLTDDVITATVSGTVLMSDYDIGPIHVAALVHTGDEIDFTLDISADRVDVGAAPADADELASNLVDSSYGDGAFSDTVLPVIEERCAACHTAGGPGHSTVQLETVGDVAELADGIALVTESRYMPPFPASPLSLKFEHDYSLDESEIAAIKEWADSGGGIDVEPDTPLRPDEVPFEPIERDQVVPARGTYVGDLAKKDDYRCFIHDIADPEGDGEWITGMTFEPDKLEVVHHSIVYRVPAEGREEAERLDGADGRPGWECFGRSNMETPGVESIGGWAPGQQPRVYPDGVGIFLKPGEMIVNQIHYHFDHDTPPDQSVLVFDTVSPEELAARDEPMTHITGRSYLTPAEGPCTPEEEGPLCDRDNMLELFDELYGGIAPFIPDALIRACGGQLDDYNELFEETKFSSSCDLKAQDHGTLYSVLGHMHEFGDAYRMTLNPDTPEERILLDIPRWSFEWQLYYVPTEEVRIEEGDVIRFECTWDRRNNTMEEPRYITWNEGTVDEMCFSSVSVIPDVNSEGEPRR